jgi:peroxiredoxin
MDTHIPADLHTASGRLIPRQPVPGLCVPTLRGPLWDLSDQRPERFTLLVFYRGWHCAVCQTYLRELERLLPEFTARGIGVFAVSSDMRERAELARDKWGLPSIDIGYGLPIAAARKWGLYVSSSRGRATNGVEEPTVFSEPGVFVIRPDQTLYWASVQTMPFARPHFSEMLQAFDMVHKIDYPARGEA